MSTGRSLTANRLVTDHNCHLIIISRLPFWQYLLEHHWWLTSLKLIWESEFRLMIVMCKLFSGSFQTVLVKTFRIQFLWKSLRLKIVGTSKGRMNRSTSNRTVLTSFNSKQTCLIEFRLILGTQIIQICLNRTLLDPVTCICNCRLIRN